MTRAAAPSVDPDPPVDWRAMVEKWAGGKNVRLQDGTTKVLPWIAMEVQEKFTGTVIHPIDYLPIGEEDHDWVVREVWDRCKDEARRCDDGIPHEFVVVCWFADIDADRKFDTRTFEKTTIEVMLPQNRAQWGHQGAYVGAKYGRAMMQRHDPHHMDQEIQWMELARGIVTDTLQAVLAENRDLRRSAQDQRNYEKELAERERNLRRDERAEKWEDLKQDAAIGAIKTVGERFARVLPVGGMRLMEALGDKISKKPPRTKRDEDSFEVLTTLVRRAKAKVERMAQAAGQADFKFTPEMLLEMLKNQFDIEEDDPVVRKLMGVLMEAELQKTKEEVEAEARGVPGRIVIEPPGQKKEDEPGEEKE